jgi:hypothetical protein
MVAIPLIAASVTSFVLTPLVIKMWQHFTPPASVSEFDALGFDVLKARNKYLDHLFTVLMFVGMVAPFPFIRNASTPTHSIALLGLAFGLMVDLPVAVIAGLTLRHGVPRFREFWRFYEIRWGIGMRGIAMVYTPIGLLGIACFVVLLLTP